MDSYRFSWIPVDSYEFIWIPRDSYGTEPPKKRKSHQAQLRRVSMERIWCPQCRNRDVIQHARTGVAVVLRSMLLIKHSATQHADALNQTQMLLIHRNP
jgi:hypothetical protein